MRRSQHEKKTRWLGENMAYLEATYPGMWVAISDEGFAGAGESVIEAKRIAASDGIHDVVFVPIKAREYQGIPIIRGCIAI